MVSEQTVNEKGHSTARRILLVIIAIVVLLAVAVVIIGQFPGVPQ